MTFLPALSMHGQAITRSQDYLRDVISLSEVLGKAHAVRIVCNGRNDQHWRAYMMRLLELEAPYQGGLRRSMVDGFNAGFATGEAMHQACDAATKAAEKDYAAQGQALTLTLTVENIPDATGR